VVANKRNYYILLVLFIFSSITFSQVSASPTEELNSIIKQYFDAKNYKSCIEQLNYFINKYPNKSITISAMWKLAECYQKIGLHEKAISVLDGLAEKHKYTKYERLARLSIAYIYYSELRLYEKAYVCYKELYEKLKNTNSEKSVLSFLINICEYTTRYEEGLTYIDILLKNYPAEKSFVYKYLPVKIDFLIKINKYSDALELCFKLLSLYNENQRQITPAILAKKETVYSTIGELYLKLNDPGKSIHYYNEAIKITKTSERKNYYRLCIGDAYIMKSNYDEAFNYYKNVYDNSTLLETNAGIAAVKIAECFEKKNDIKTTFYWLLKAGITVYEPGYFKLYNFFETKVEILMKNKMYDSALKVFVMAKSYLLEMDTAGLLENISKVKEIILRSLLSAGDCLERLNQKHIALEYYRLIIQKFPAEAIAIIARKKMS